MAGAFGRFFAFDPDRGEHEVFPDQRRESSAIDRLAAEVGSHRLGAFGIADPYRDGVLAVPTDEPRVDVVRGRAGLAGGKLSDRRRSAGAVLDHGLEHLGLGFGDSRRQDLTHVRVVDFAMAAVGEAVRWVADFLNADRQAFAARERAAHALAAVRDRLVGVGHVQWGDADFQAADRHRVVGGYRGGDAHLVRDARDLARSHLDSDFGEDRVVGDLGSADQSVGARVGAFVVVDDEDSLESGTWKVFTFEVHSE